MALPVNMILPSANSAASYSVGMNSAVRAVGLVSSADQVEAVAMAQRDGRMGPSGFLKIPREVLFLQDERGAKIKSGGVSSSTKSDMDEERLLSKLQNTTDHAIEAIHGQAGGDHGDAAEKDPPSPDQPSAHADDHHGVSAPGVLGSGNIVYQGVLAATGASLSGRNFSVLA